MARLGRTKNPKAPRPAVVDAYLRMLTTERGVAVNTLLAYEHDLTDAYTYLDTQGIDIVQATAEDLKNYLEALGNRDNAKNKGGGKTGARTIARRITVLHQFFKFLNLSGHRPDDPTIALKTPKAEQTRPIVLSTDEVQALITTAQKRGGRKGLRLVALLEILYATGLRVSELVGLPLAAIDTEGRYLTIKSKGGRERRAVLTETARQAMKAYRDTFLGVQAQGQWLFPSRLSDAGHLTRQRFSKLLEDLSVEAGIDPKRVSPSAIRHAFEANFLKKSIR